MRIFPRTVLICTVLAMFGSLPVFGQNTFGLWTGVGLEKKISKGTNLDLEVQYRLTDYLKATDRWSTGISFSKRLYRNFDKTFNIKAAAEYKFIRVLNPESVKYKGELYDIPDNQDPEYYIDGGHDYNFTESYWENKHRFIASLQSALEVGRFKFSLRENFQYTFSDSVETSRTQHRFYAEYDPEIDDFVAFDSPVTENVWKGGGDKSVLRSRIGVDYDIPNWKYNPFASFELFNRTDRKLALDKTRLTAGVEFTFANRHNFKIAYLWQDRTDEDEPSGSAISINYKFEL